MTRQEFIEGIKQLSIEDRIALIEAITRSLRQDLNASGDATVSESESLDAGDAERERKIAAVRRLKGALKSQETSPSNEERKDVSLSQQMHGVLKSDGAPPTDDEIKEMYAEYLTEKYS